MGITTYRLVAAWVLAKAAQPGRLRAPLPLVSAQPYVGSDLMPIEQNLGASTSMSDCYLRILFSNGVKGGRLFVVDALGCLCSLRARSALDGVSWVQGG